MKTNLAGSMKKALFSYMADIIPAVIVQGVDERLNNTTRSDFFLWKGMRARVSP